MSNLFFLLKIRNITTLGVTRSSKFTAIGMSMFMWICPSPVLIYCCFNLGNAIMLRDTDRAELLKPVVVQVGFLFGVATIVTGATHVLTLRLATPDEQGHRQARALVKKAIKTTALQFISAAFFQVLPLRCGTKASRFETCKHTLSHELGSE